MSFPLLLLVASDVQWLSDIEESGTVRPAALRRPRPHDPEPPHQRLQRRTLHSTPGGGAPRATEGPVRLPEDPENVHPLHSLEGRGSVLVISPGPTPPELGERNLERPPLREDHRPLDEVRELPHVPRPRIPAERLERLAGDHLDVPIHRAGETLHEETDQRGDVVGSLAQRRDVDREDVQAVVEVVAEALLLDQPGQVAVRRGDKSDVDLDRPGAADTLELLLLEDPEELRLELERDLAHLVEEERAAMGHLEASDLLRDGPGERAPLVAEEFTLEEPRWDSRAIDLDEGSLAAAASVVDGARDQFLSRAGLAEDEHGRVGRRDGLHLLEDVSERAALADDFPERVLGADLALEVDALLGEPFRELGDLPECERVGDRHRHLAGDRLDHRDRRWREGIGLNVAHGQRAEPAVAA